MKTPFSAFTHCHGNHSEWKHMRVVDVCSMLPAQTEQKARTKMSLVSHFWSTSMGHFVPMFFFWGSKWSHHRVTEIPPFTTMAVCKQWCCFSSYKTYKCTDKSCLLLKQDLLLSPRHSSNTYFGAVLLVALAPSRAPQWGLRDLVWRNEGQSVRVTVSGLVWLCCVPAWL